MTALADLQRAVFARGAFVGQAVVMSRIDRDDPDARALASPAGIPTAGKVESRNRLERHRADREARIRAEEPAEENALTRWFASVFDTPASSTREADPGILKAAARHPGHGDVDAACLNISGIGSRGAFASIVTCKVLARRLAPSTTGRDPSCVPRLRGGLPRFPAPAYAGAGSGTVLDRERIPWARRE